MQPYRTDKEEMNERKRNRIVSSKEAQIVIVFVNDSYLSFAAKSEKINWKGRETL